MSEESKTTNQRQFDPRLRYLAPVVVLLVVVLCFLILAVTRSGDNRDNGLKPFRPTRTPFDGSINGQILSLEFMALNDDPAAYENQRLRVTGNLIILPEPDCRLYTGPAFTWGLVAEDLQLNARGFDELAARLPGGLAMTVEGIWRKYDGPLGCGKGPADGVAWYLQVERIVSPNPLPLVSRTVVPTQVGGGFVATRPGIVVTPFETSTPVTAVTDQPGIGITPLSTNTPALPGGTQPPPASATPIPTATRNGLMTTTPVPGQTSSPTPVTGSTATATVPGAGTGTATPTVTPSATTPGLATQTPAATVPGYPNPNTPVPTTDPYS